MIKNYKRPNGYKSQNYLARFCIVSALIFSFLAACSAQPTASASDPVATSLQKPTASPAPPTNTPLPTQTPVTLPPLETRSQPSVSKILATLENLPIDAFFDQSFQYLILRSPETITELGLSSSFGLRDNYLDDISDEFMRDTQALEAGILEILRTYDRASLLPQDQVSYDVYAWHLENQVRGHEFMYHDYPLHHFLGSYHLDLQLLLTEKHPLETRQNAEDYIYRLSQVDKQVAQLIEGLGMRLHMGVVPPPYILELTRASSLHDLGLSDIPAKAVIATGVESKNLAVFRHFSNRLNRIEEFTPNERQALLDAAQAAIEASYIPAYISLINYLDKIMPLAKQDAGAWKLPDGEAYYEYILHTKTNTNLSPTEVHNLGLQEVSRIQAEMRAAFAELGYPADEDLGTLVERAIQDGGFYKTTNQAEKQQVVIAYESILADMGTRLDEVFEIGPEAAVIVKGAPFGGGGFYESASIDGTRPGIFYAGTGSDVIPKFNMSTIAYHEAIPGHHYQIALSQELDLPLFRNVLFFNGYGEGWAVYSEKLAWEMGFYEDDPYGNIGRLQLELLRAIRMVADTGIHAKGWTREEAQDYLKEALGDPDGEWVSEIDRYIVRPGQASGYLVGMLKILELRQYAMDELGDQFNIRQFHTLILGNGSLPLEILEEIVYEYVHQTVQSK